MFSMVAIYEHDLLKELQIKTDDQSVNKSVGFRAFAKRLHLQLRLVAKTAAAEESVSPVGPR